MLIAARNAFMTRLLPYDAELEYLESTGTQWIDTEINSLSAITDFDFEITARFLSVPSVGYIGSGFSSSSGVQMFYAINVTDTTGLYMACNSITNITSNLSADKTSWHSVRATSTGGVVRYYFDGVQVSSFTSSTFTLPYLYLFAIANPNGSSSARGKQQISSFRFSANGILVRDFIPVRRGTTGYLYDRVTRRLFGNAGTGDFVLGPDVVPVEYLESHRTEWIDTVVPNQNDIEIYAEAKILTFQNNRALFGVAGGGATTTQRCITAQNPDDSTKRIILQRAAYGYSGRKYILWDDNWHKYWLSKSEAKIDASSSRSDNIANDTTDTICTFAMKSAGSIILPMACQYKEFTLSNNGILILRLLPVRVGTDATSWEGAMMDVLTRRIYRNAGTGAFTFGNDLKYPIPKE